MVYDCGIGFSTTVDDYLFLNGRYKNRKSIRRKMAIPAIREVEGLADCFFSYCR